MTMFWKGVLVLGLAVVGVAVAVGLPDMKRYLRLRRM
jgi:hypothetical protein